MSTPTSPTSSVTDASPTVDVLVVGGGAAGLSAATVLARSRRSVLVLDAAEPRNAPADGVHGFLGHDGVPPLELLARGRAELESYGGRVVTAEAVSATTDDDAVTVRTAAGDVHRARHLVVTTGAVDRLPEVDGLARHWGRGVVHCPYCHGWEVRDQRVVVLAASPAAMHQVGLFGQLTDRLAVLAHDADALDDAARDRLARLDVPVHEGPATGVVECDGTLVGLETAAGVVPADAVVVASFVEPRSALLDGLGLAVLDLEMGGTVLARHVEADPVGRTALPRVWAAGNVVDPMSQVVLAAGAGMRLGAALNGVLVVEDQETRLAG
ncbi:NAD(P)/FAD-dependent oxidoreductase [Phycicoccus sp. BSK3Z-2]|uniref:NAD(P)/FAD-dependent oxidoreductase n=1 Tax=Phycicoccus avicenniae TaxID=2828860 RepID=A0A941HXX4_9MICO|nr:NAD(P)/FAD-dependent oxidoreductase [Phycicoccus avicenniae]MBR7742313.1 NAD(P)/FAD-dependent oxidoreductase [Phycicoccus avicenniae]